MQWFKSMLMLCSAICMLAIVMGGSDSLVLCLLSAVFSVVGYRVRV